MTDKEKKDIALKSAGDILIAAFGDMYGTIKFNLQGKRKTVHCSTVNTVEVEVLTNKQFVNADNRQERTDK